MFQRSRKGYIEQQIEGLTLILAKILTGKSEGRYESALAEAAEACKRLTGLNLATLTMLPDETLLNLFRMGGGLDPARCVIAGRLLAAQADVYETQGRTVAAHVSLHKALVLLLEAMRVEEGLRTEEGREEIAAILARLQGYTLPDDVQARVTAYRRLLPS